MRNLILIGVIAGALALAGCGDSSELNKQDSATLDHNLNRDLTPEEVSKIGGGTPAEAPKKEAGN